jgi:hypothetical protein
MKRILLIAPAFGVDQGVGAMRMNDWASRLHEIGWDTTVVTVSQQIAQNVHVVAPEAPILSWTWSVWRWSRDKTWDVVLFSGGPFTPFLLGIWWSWTRRFPVILDFRDPLALNPKFNDSLPKKILKQLYQWVCVRSARAVITVNRQCARLMNFPAEGVVIPNGFDEKQLLKVLRNSKSPSGGKPTLIHAGKWYCDPSALVSAMIDQATITSIGMPFPPAPHVTQFGQLPYADVLSQLHRHDVGLILAQGSAFETLTKIFDYAGLGMRIWVISDLNEADTGIRDVLKGYEGVVFSLNTTEGIKAGWVQIQKLPTNPKPAMHLSRQASFLKLLQVLESSTA